MPTPMAPGLDALGLPARRVRCSLHSARPQRTAVPSLRCLAAWAPGVPPGSIPPGSLLASPTPEPRRRTRSRRPPALLQLRGRRLFLPAHGGARGRRGSGPAPSPTRRPGSGTSRPCGSASGFCPGPAAVCPSGLLFLPQCQLGRCLASLLGPSCWVLRGARAQSGRGQSGEALQWISMWTCKRTLSIMEATM